MDTFAFLFHLTALNDPTFLGSDDTNTILTMEANRLRWDSIPDLGVDKVTFATGYVMGREGMAPDPRISHMEKHDYEVGYSRGSKVREGVLPRPDWDRATVPS
jgi:hypothetical protein